jgi:hypothetical protein
MAAEVSGVTASGGRSRRKCLDLNNGSAQNGTPVQIGDCAQPGFSAQTWTFL